MKNKLKIFCILCLTILMSGCVKYNFKMEVGKDDSFTFAITTAIDKTMTENGTTTIDEEEEAAIKAKGFTIEDYEDEKWKGSIVTKKFDNIDDISSKEEVIVDINDILDSEKEDIKYYFQKDGDTYKANFIVNLVDETAENGETTPEEDQYIQQVVSTMDLKYEVTLPVKPVKNNATSVSEDGMTLTWNLEFGKANLINFEFKKYNTAEKEDTPATNNSQTDDKAKDEKKENINNIILYVIIGGAALVVIVLLVVIISKKKKTPPTGNGNVASDSTVTNNNVSTNGPTNLAQPVEPVSPVEQVSVNETVTPSEPTNLTQPVVPVSPVEQASVNEMVTSSEPTDLPQPVEPVSNTTEQAPVNETVIPNIDNNQDNN